MYESTCGVCGAPLFAVHKCDLRRFCSKKCYGAFLHLQASEKDKVDDLQDMPKLKDLSEDGFIKLVTEIVKQASDDVLHFPEGSVHRVTAEKFFLSDYFEKLTGFDGIEMLEKLHKQLEKKKKRKAAKNDLE